ncbi:hypothetical protein AVEN_84893-1, partial [Araneus ventricosus]
ELVLLKRELLPPCYSVRGELKNGRRDSSEFSRPSPATSWPLSKEDCIIFGGGQLKNHKYYAIRRSENPLTYPVAPHQ